MNWDAIGSIAELLGAAGVIVSLVYLSIQIKTNTNTIKASAAKDTYTGWADFNYDVSKHPDRVTIDQMWKPESKWSDFSKEQQTFLGLVCRSIIERFEAEYSLFEAGLLKPEVWEKHKVYCGSFIRLPAVSTWWESEKKQPICSDSFIRELESAATYEGLTAGSLSEK